MGGHVFKINDLKATGSKTMKHISLCRACVSVNQDQTMGKGGFVKHRLHKPTIAAIAAGYRFGPPTDLGQDGSHRPRSLSAAPAVYQRTPSPGLGRKGTIQMTGHVTCNNCGTDLAGCERTFLLIDRADPGTFFVRHRGQADRAGDVVLGIFCR